MRDHGIDGAAVQRFVGSLADPVMHKRVNRVLDNVRHGAEANGRVFYIVYDVSGARPESVISTIRQDWKHLVEDSHITDSPSYLRDHGKPVLQLWGFGFCFNKTSGKSHISRSVCFLYGYCFIYLVSD